MLTQTKRIKDYIISCGILKNDIRVRTPLSKRLGGYDKTHICIMTNAYNKAKYILRLRKFFNLIITTHGHDISHIGIYDDYIPDGKKGKIRIFDIVKNDFREGYHVKSDKKSCDDCDTGTNSTQGIQDHKAKQARTPDKRTYKTKIYSVDDTIGDAGHDNLYGLGDIDHKRRFYVFLYKEVCGKKSPVYKYFDTMQKAVNFRDTIKDELKRGLYQ